MSITFSGLGSGLDVSSWIEQLVAIQTAKITAYEEELEAAENKKAAFTQMKTTYSTLRNTAETFTDAQFGTESDIFAKNKVTSSDSSIFTATATSTASRQTFDIQVKQLATQTVATGTKAPAEEISEKTLLRNINPSISKDGTLSIYLDNEKYTIQIDQYKHLSEIKEQIEALDDSLSVSVEDGKFSISAEGKQLTMGSNSDTSSFMSVLGLRRNEDGDGYESINPITRMNTTAALVSDESGFGGEIDPETGKREKITTGQFKIGNATIYVDENTTMNNLVTQINSNKASGATAYFNTTTGKLVLTSTSEGNVNINIEKGTTNFTEIFGLTEDGKIAEGSQITGKNAILSIDGVEVESLTNTVTSASTGITGLTINLKKVSEEGKSSTLKIERNNDEILEAVRKFVDAYNDAITQTETATDAETGTLAFEWGMSSIANEVKSIAMSAVASGIEYPTLYSIGIYTDKIGSTSETVKTTLTFDEETFLAALDKNPDQVKAVFISDTKAGTEGIMNKLYTYLNKKLDPESGYFATSETSMDGKIELIQDKIDRKQEYIDAYEARITRQFNAMDEAIGKMQNQYDSLSSLLSSLSTNSSSS